ncbi:MAG TPA: hypothetical protein DCM86_07990 [Verrucomicrobiales bacterium]|nr:hypothetical protein [Verrucomicrobiales bacterium]
MPLSFAGGPRLIRIASSLFCTFLLCLFSLSGALAQSAPSIRVNPAGQTLIAGGVVTFTAGALLTVNSGPKLTGAPGDIAVSAGITVGFAATASGFPTPTVQWQVSTDGGVTFVDIPGATSTTLSFPAQAADNGKQFRAVFTNPLGTATTPAATLTVNIAPVVVSTPSDKTVNAGTTVSFAAAASGRPAPTVQWQVSPGGSGGFSNMTGATADVLSFTAQATDHGHYYRAIYSNYLGIAATPAARLNVNTAPVITLNPAWTTTTEAQTVTLTAAATGFPAPTVQWQLSADNGATFSNIAGATALSLTFTASAADNLHWYRAVFTNPVGNATTAGARLTVQAAPAITLGPVPQTRTEGTVINLTADATGTPPPLVQWQASADGGITFTNIPGETAKTYSFPAAAPLTGHQYRAVFQNLLGTATTAAAEITVIWPPHMTLSPASITVFAGQTFTLTSDASASPAPTVQWSVSRDGGLTFTPIPGATHTNYTAIAAEGDNGNRYGVIYRNSIGTTGSSYAILTVETLPRVLVQPESVGVVYGRSVTLYSRAVGEPAPAQLWQKSTDGGLSFVNLAGATGTNLVLIPASLDDGSRYRSLFTNVVGSVTSQVATISVYLPPTILQHPANQTVFEASMASFTATAAGRPTPIPAWQVSHDHGITYVDLAGTGTTNLMFLAVQGDNGLSYRAKFTNAGGTNYSAGASLTVKSVARLTKLDASGGGLAFGGTNTIAGSYVLVTSPSLTIPVSQWQPLATNIFGASGPFSFLVPGGFSKSTPSAYFLLIAR